MHYTQKICGCLVLAICLFLFNGCERSQRAEVKKAKIDGVEIAYYTRGSGEPLMMLMGFKGTMGVWDPGLLEILEKKYQLILFDYRGTGFSTDSEKDLTTVPKMAEDTVNLMKALGLKSAHVLGWSMGTRIAVEIAVKHPEMVNTLTLCSPNPGGEHSTAHTDAFKKLISPHLTEQEVLSIIYPDNAVGKGAADAFIRRLAESITDGSIPEDLKINPRTVERQAHALKEWDSAGTTYQVLPNIKAPTLVAGGLADVLDLPENVQTVACRIPFAWTAFFPGAGHYFFSQDYEGFADLLTLFIETNKKK
jgi:pimeloyl-ACP methyl ester carboxylesterase